MCSEITPLMVLKSGAGFYIGKLCDAMPYSRNSMEYFQTEKEAQKALAENSYTPRNYA